MAFVPALIAAGATALSSAGAAVGSMFAGSAAAGAAGAASASMGAGMAATAMNTVGGIMGAVGSYQSGMFQSKIANYNAQLALQNKSATLQAGTNAEEIKRMQTGKMVGSEEASQAAGGVDVGGGSAVDVRDATKMAGEMDALNIRYNAARQAYGYQQEAFSDMIQAKSAKESAISGLVGGLFKAGGSFMSGASSLTDKWLQYQMSGALQVPTSQQPIDTVLNTQG